MTHGSLFSGIGGFDLAALYMGWSNVFQCETNDFCRTILKYHFPNTELHGDIKTTDFSKYKGTIDIVSGGFPCQPFSIAGSRKGTEDNRYLWKEMFRAICEISPSWIVAENVLGIVNWNGGLVFQQVCSDLETAGYQVQPFVLPAASVNAPHKRYRVWFVANSASSRYIGWCKKNNGRQKGISEITRYGNERTFTDTKSTGQQTCTTRQEKGQFGRENERMELSSQWQNFPTQSPVCSRNDGISDQLYGITFPAWRRKSIEAYGNAVVPQIVLQIFKAIEEMKLTN